MKRFAMLTGLVAMTMTLIVAAQQPPTPAKDPAAQFVASLQGKWQVTTMNGAALSDNGMDMTLTITGDKYAQTVNGTVSERGSYKLDVTKKPMTIDLIITEGSDAGTTQLGVIEVTGDAMKGKLNAPGVAQRPTDFTVQEGFIGFAATRVK